MYIYIYVYIYRVNPSSGLREGHGLRPSSADFSCTGGHTSRWHRNDTVGGCIWAIQVGEARPSSEGSTST